MTNRSIRNGSCKSAYRDEQRPRLWNDGRAKFEASPGEYMESVDPVCGMAVERATAEHLSAHSGSRLYFCSSRCKGKFDAAPETYLKAKPTPEPMLLICAES